MTSFIARFSKQFHHACSRPKTYHKIILQDSVVEENLHCRKSRDAQLNPLNFAMLKSFALSV
jgi:hypothetical protein